MEILTIAKGEQDITTIADKLYISYHTARGHINSIKKNYNSKTCEKQPTGSLISISYNLHKRNMRKEPIAQQQIPLSIKN
ncbi:helix-turn-helix domain-containing protein [Parabacteroides distasonis]|uniref:hypothetical protein n=1 Tax=Parabacteroides distasonis TaxID=823 RepID=UPI0021C5D9F1|nr:hypothetical protein [Parabacteroides distasonis]